MPPLKKFLITTGSLGVFIALFPWLFAYKGSVAGINISIRAIGDPIGIVCALIGIAILISKSLQEKVIRLASSLDELSNGQQQKLLFVATFFYVAGVISHKLRAQVVMGTHAFDLGFFSNICWNTLHGDWFYSSILERNFMAVHVNWILWPLSVFYRLFSGAEVLLVAQAVMVAMVVPILWRTAQKITGSFTGGLMASLLFVSSPYIGHTISNDFHPDVWLLPCLFLAVSAWCDKKPARLIFFGLLSLLAKEDVSVVLCGFGAFLLLQKNWRLTGLLLLSASIGIFLFHTQFFIPRFLEGGHTSILYSRYSFLGNNFQEMARNLFMNPMVYARAFLYEPTKFWRFACYFFPVAGLTFLSPLFLIPPILSVMPHLFSQASTQLSLADIYSLPSQAFIFIGAVLGANKLLGTIGRRRVVHLAGFLLIIAGGGIFRSPRYFRSEKPERIRAFHELKSLVPLDVPVAAQQNLLPHFDCRRFIQLFPLRTAMSGLQTKVLENPDYIVCDRIGNALPWNEIDLGSAIAEMEQNSDYEKIFERENFVLFKRSRSEELRWRAS